MSPQDILGLLEWPGKCPFSVLLVGTARDPLCARSPSGDSPDPTFFPLQLSFVDCGVGVHCATSAFPSGRRRQLLVTNVKPVVNRSVKAAVTSLFSSLSFRAGIPFPHGIDDLRWSCFLFFFVSFSSRTVHRCIMIVPSD